MKLFKIIASRGGNVLFDDRLEAPTPREARNQMRGLLGMKSLTGVVYSITEIPVELIGEIAAARVAEALARFDEGTPPPSLEEIIRVAAAEEVRRQLAELRSELATLAPSAPEAETAPERFDPFQAPAEPAEPTAPPSPVVERVQANVEERRRRQPRGRPSVTTDGRTIDWRAVKKLYLRNRSLKQTAAAFDLSPNTVKARARKEGWAQ
jgi:DNA-directed RNA polymerase specialized sigma24 family protein